MSYKLGAEVAPTTPRHVYEQIKMGKELFPIVQATGLSDAVEELKKVFYKNGVFQAHKMNVFIESFCFLRDKYEEQFGDLVYLEFRAGHVKQDGTINETRFVKALKGKTKKKPNGRSTRIINGTRVTFY